MDKSIYEKIDEWQKPEGLQKVLAGLLVIVLMPLFMLVFLAVAGIERVRRWL